MPQHYAGRVTAIAVVVWLALSAVFQSAPGSAFWLMKLGRTPVSLRPSLKPGIDMVGGTRLVYEIQVPEGGGYTDNLAEQVASSLKRRVDPDGVRNLIWRPQGNSRLEIQMPLSPQSGESAQKRADYAAAQKRLEETNLRTSEVLRAIEKKSGDERRAEIMRLTAGSERRAALLGAMASLWDQITQAKTAGDAQLQAQKELEYDKLKAQLTDTNLSPAELETYLGLKPEKRDEKLAELRKEYAGWDARLSALDTMASAYAQYSAVRGGLDDAADLKRLLRGSGVLEFHILVEPGNPQAQPMIERLHRKGPLVQAGDTMRWYEVDKDQQVSGIVETFNDKRYVLAHTAPEKSMTNREGTRPWGLVSATATRNEYGAPVVAFRFDLQGGKYFADLTSKHQGQPLAIMLDERVISAPNINEPITGGSGTITGKEGGFTQAELRYLVSTLSAGSLPARLTDDPIMEQTVGPQLGEDNLKAGFIACGFGLVVVAVFLIGYYYLAGVVATFAVLLNLVLILGAMAALNATFTLPGIAGIVLTIGMAVDANVLIFERLREEQLRGLGLRMALRNAYDRAWSAILDGNVTTGITSAFLFLFGSEEVKGFGLTLLIGIVCSLFTALYVTKTIFSILIDRFGVRQLGSLPLSFPAWDRALRPNIDWMGKAWAFYVFSLVFIAVGLTAFGVRMAQGRMLDVEFAAGTSVQVELNAPMKIDDVRDLIEAEARKSPADLPSPGVVSVDRDDLTYEVVTPNKEPGPVRAAIERALGDKLKLERASKFAGAGEPFDLARGTRIVPVTSDDQQIAGFVPDKLASHLDGVAIVLEGIDPPLSAQQIAARIERVRMQQTGVPYRAMDVVTDARRDDEPAATAVVLVSDPSTPLSVDEQRWVAELAAPTWSLVNEALSAEGQLQRVTNFDAQVAGETRRQAAIALALSIVGIMAYIWVRFGNLKFGTATVVALLHDTLFTVAAVGMAHYLWEWGLGGPLLLEPFRVNLNLVAAVLTVMGYSMNDTVVVFDRIRENRGRYGVVSRSVINDSINQTLSRTLLTGGTTILTIFVMYAFGGAGIHGFTFALLVGIVVGTYSSIAIASPILLLGGTAETAEERARNARAAPVGQLQRV